MNIKIICFPKCSYDEIYGIEKKLEEQLNVDKSRITVVNQGKLPPAIMIDPSRNQYISERILEYLSSQNDKNTIMIAVIKYDAYAYYYNFVFGHADPVNKVCAVYTSRLETGKRELYLERLSKEVLHEVGHVLGLYHCSDKSCVMSFSNNIFDVDKKTSRFCSKCKAVLGLK